MISFFRSIFQSKIGLFFTMAFVALIAISFSSADVGGSGTFGGITDSGVAATVGSKEIGNGELSKSTNNAFQANQRENPGLDIRAFVNQGGLDQTLDQLINSFSLSVFGSDNGVTAGKRLIDSEIVDIPAFQGPSGTFDETTFRRTLQQQGIDEKQLRDDFGRNLIAEQLLTPVGSSATIPDKLVVPYASLLLESRAGRVAAVPAGLFLKTENPGNEKLTKFYKDNSIRYTIPERRSVRYSIFDRSRFDDISKPSEEEIKKFYDDNAANYAASETRDLEQVIVPTEAAAAALLTQIETGQTLSQAAASAGLSAAEIKTVSKSDYTKNTSAAVADAAFGASSGAVTPPSQSGLGWHIVRIAKINNVAAKSLQSVSSEIAAALTKQKADQATSDFTVALEDAFSGGSTLDDVAKDEQLKVETTPKLLPTGINPDDRSYKPIAEMAKILPIAFTMEEEDDPQLLELEANNRFAVVDVVTIEPSAPPPLSKIADRVLRDYQLDEAAGKAKVAAEAIAKKVQAGTSLAKAMTESGLKLPPAQAVGGTRAQLTQAGQNVPPPLTLMFSMAEKTAKTITLPGNQGWMIVHLEKIVGGDATKEAGLVDAAKAQFGQIIGQEYTEQFVNAVKKELGVVKNESSILALKQRLTGTISVDQ